MKSDICILIFLFISFSTFSQETNFEYRNENKYLKLIISTGKPYLILNEPTKLKVVLENVDVEKITASGLGLSPLGYFQTYTQLLFKVLVEEKSIVEGNWELKLVEMKNGNELWQHIFKIPVINKKH